MKKLLVLAVVALLATSAFAQRHLTMAQNATYGPGTATGTPALGPTTTNNDDSCDISVAPAATLLLPYFAVDLAAPATSARTTLFTVTNTSYLPQIAHVVVWTDWSFPVLDFNLFLTGYDVAPINMYDLLGGGGRPGAVNNSNSSDGAIVGINTPKPPSNSAVGTWAAPAVAAASPWNNANPNFTSGAASSCVAANLPGPLPASLIRDVQSLLTVGYATAGSTLYGSCNTAANAVGGNHPALAQGYVTIDVVANCNTLLPGNPDYWAQLLFDNVLTGEYYDVNPAVTAGNYAGGNPLVHIRAVPEGGPAGLTGAAAITTNLPYTFYDRYTTTAPTRTYDRRQPLPSTFAARWISGGGTGFDTRYKIWREGLTIGDPNAAACGDYTGNGGMTYAQMVRFDEAENANVFNTAQPIYSPQIPGTAGTLPETSQTPVTTTDVFPPLATGNTATGGWMYMNLNNVGTSGTRTLSGPDAAAGYSSTTAHAGTVTVARGPMTPVGATTSIATSTATGQVRQSQNWVIVSMFAEGRYGVDYDATWLGNGCSVSPSTTTQIGPAGGVLVCPTGVTTTPAIGGGNALCTGTNVTP